MKVISIDLSGIIATSTGDTYVENPADAESVDAVNFDVKGSSGSGAWNTWGEWE